MAINLISIKCPECGADLSIESGREFAFCSYCGTKVMINNENEHIIRTIDEAGIKQAETDRIVKMRQLDMEEKSIISRKAFVVVWITAMIILVILGIIGLTINNEGLMICIILAFCVGSGGMLHLQNDKQKKKVIVAGTNEVLITNAMENTEDKNYQAVEMLFKSAGFTNVSTVPLNDLNLLNMRKNGQVDSVTINGIEDFSENDVFPKNANVLITFHSK